MTEIPIPHFVDLFAGARSLSERLRQMHEHLRASVPQLDRVACALYDESEDRLKTFLHSTRTGEALRGYEFPLHESQSLLALARSGEMRVLDHIPKVIGQGSEHAQWLQQQGYQSSFTVPMYGQGTLLGFVFFDSLQPEVFSATVQRDLVLACSLINMMISSEMATVRMMLASTQIARDFANLRDFETGAHLERMSRYARLIARAVAPRYGLDDEFVENIYQFAPLHDIGKIGIPDRILLKEGSLDAAEHSIMETHVELGCTLVGKMMGDFRLNDLPHSAMIHNIVAYHHELLDGSGYPKGVKAPDIPIEARIVTVADIFDALTSPRPYKEGWPTDLALAELQRMAEAGQLDPHCVAALAQERATIDDITRRFCDTL
jgi:HD-GYP domain-containing protein (c-di-GMP phosphodiesterase class II)